MTLPAAMNRPALPVKVSMLIYKATNLVNGKVYIGKTTKTLYQRRIGHLKASKSKRSNSIFHKAIRKYGIESFSWEVLGHYENTADLDAAEIQFIESYDSCVAGYNITRGGGGIVGYRHTEVTKELMGRSTRGKKLPKETIQKMKAAKAEHWQDPKYHQKQVKAAENRWQSQEELDQQAIRRGSRKFEILKDGIVIWSGYNKRQAGRLLGLDPTLMLRCLQGRFKQHRGHTFRYCP